MNDTSTILTAAQAAVEAHRANPKVAVWRLAQTLEQAVEWATGLKDDVGWERRVSRTWDTHRLATELEQLIESCLRHRGPGLRQARVLKARARAMLRAWQRHGYDQEANGEVGRLIEEHRRLVGGGFGVRGG